jgi:hypothetical protein
MRSVDGKISAFIIAVMAGTEPVTALSDFSFYYTSEERVLI